MYTSTLSDDEVSDDEDALEPTSFDKIYEFPELDAKIRQVIDEYGAVFPKLNWTSPQVSQLCGLYRTDFDRQTSFRIQVGY